MPRELQLPACSQGSSTFTGKGNTTTRGTMAGPSPGFAWAVTDGRKPASLSSLLQPLGGSQGQDIVTSTTPAVIIKCLDKQFSLYRLPRTLKTNNGANLVSAEMEKYLNQMGIKHQLTTPFWPRAHGEGERQNRSLLKAMRAAQGEKKDLRSGLNKYLTAYRATPHKTTDACPAELLCGRQFSTKLPELANIGDSDEPAQQEVRDRDAQKRKNGWDYVVQRDHAVDGQDVQQGDLVLLEKKKETKLPSRQEKHTYHLLWRHGDQVHLKSAQDVGYKRNIQNAKRFMSPPTDPDFSNPIIAVVTSFVIIRKACLSALF